MKPIICLVLLAIIAPVRSAHSADPAEELQATFKSFVAAQNAHDLKALEPLLLDSPQFLWVTRGTVVWGRVEALKRFETLYQGTWKLDPDMTAFRVVITQPQVAQIFVPIVFSIGPAGQPPQETRVHMNQTLLKVDGAWRVASILPIPVPPPAPPK